jgi:ABC-type bacteriocin/lantibiotic exporter with double-glycine peptidase domain
MSETSRDATARRLLYGPVRRAALELLSLSLFVNLLALATPIFTLQVYDRVIAFAGMTTLQGLVLGMVVVLAFDFLLRQARARLMQRVAVRLDAEIGRALVDRLLAVPLATLDAKPSVQWHTVLRDVDVVRNTFAGATALLVLDLPFAVGFLAVIWILAPAIAWVFPLLLAAFVALSWGSGLALTRRSSAETAATMERDRLVGEMVQNRAMVKALNLDESMRTMWEDRHATAIRQSLRRGVHTDTYVNIGNLMTIATTVIVTTVGALAIMEQQMSVGGLIAVNMLSGRVVAAFNQLFSGWRSYVLCRQSLGRIKAILALDTERQDSPVELKRPVGTLRVEAASFSYVGTKRPAIEAATVAFQAPGLHAVVGRNGGGKTTLLRMLMGLHVPETGRVVLDGADIRQYARRDLLRWIGYVPQEIVLFAGTIRDNLARAIPGASDDEIVRAAEAARAHGFIVDLPDGYGTDIGEAGQRLSSGQRQRLALARALVPDPPVLLLDEPTSFLDRQVETDLIQTLVELARERCIVTVTHSTALLSAATTVTVVDQGRIVGHGPASEMLPRMRVPRGVQVAPAPTPNSAAGPNPGTPLSVAASGAGGG